MRWRLSASLLTVLTAGIAVATAVLGPMYLHTAGDSVLRQTVASAAVEDRGVTVVPNSDVTHPLAAVQRAERIVKSAGGARGWYGAPITTVESGVTVPNGDKSKLFWRTGICHVLRFQRGGCDLGSGDVVMTARGARQIGASLGTTVSVQVTGRSAPLRLKVTGITFTPDLGLPYWWGDGIEDFPVGHSFGGPGEPAATDPLIASPATALAVPALDVPAATGQVPLRAGAVSVGDESAVKQALSRTGAILGRQGMRAGTQLPSLLADADHQRDAMATIVAIAATQLVLLAVWVLGSVVVRSSDARRSEARVARLRGFPGVSMLWVTAAEPGLLCLFGVVLGVAAAWLAIVAARGALLVPSAAIAFDGSTFAALGLTVAAIAGALGVGTVRLLRSDDGAVRVTRPSGALGMSRVADVVLVVLAIVALVALATTGALNGHADPLASAAPGLIALGIAVLAVQLILFACRLAIPLTADSGRLGSFLALRQTVRRPGVLRQARVLIIALCLACFAAAAWSVARSNRATASQFQVGSRTVVTVAPQSATNLERAVKRMDPRGRFAMATIDVHTPSMRLLAVDAPRLSTAVSWPAGISSAGLASIIRRLDPPTVPAVQLPGGLLRVSAQTTLTAARADLDLGMWVFSGSGGTTTIDLGRLQEGERTYRGDLAGVCPGGCRLAGLGILPAAGRPPPTTGNVKLSIGQVWSQLPAGASRTVPADLIPGGWRSTATGVRVQPRADGLTLTATAAAIDAEAGATGLFSPPMASPADHPLVLPAVATSEFESINAGQVGPESLQGLDGNSVSVRAAVSASALPRVGANALMVDLGLLSHMQVGPTIAGATDEVWLGPRAPVDALVRLRDTGLKPIAVERSSAVLKQLQRSGPALADDFLLLAMIAALAVAAASTLGAFGAATRERATELASWEVAGVPRPALARSLGLESSILILTALCGAGAGALAAVMALPSLPEMASASLAPLSYGLPWGVLAAVTLAVLAAVALAAAIVSTILLHRASPALLRTVPDDLSA